MQVIIHQIANQRWTLIWIWRVILISRFGIVKCYAIYMNNHIFFLNSTDMCSIPRNETQCSSVQSDGWQSIFSELAGSVSGLAALAAHSCMGLRKHGLTHWDPRCTGLANELIDHWQVHKKLPPHLAYILWNCSGVDVNNLEAILVMTWHRQWAFQIQYGIF